MDIKISIRWIYIMWSCRFRQQKTKIIKSSFCNPCHGFYHQDRQDKNATDWKYFQWIISTLHIHILDKRRKYMHRKHAWCICVKPLRDSVINKQMRRGRHPEFQTRKPIVWTDVTNPKSDQWSNFTRRKNKDFCSRLIASK